MQTFTIKQKLIASAKLAAIWIGIAIISYGFTIVARELSLYGLADIFGFGLIIGLSAAAIFAMFPFLAPEWFIDQKDAVSNA